MFFPANSTWILQPNDQYVFGTFKRCLQQLFADRESAFALLGKNPSYTLASCVPAALDAITPRTVSASYEHIGLCPFNRTKMEAQLTAHLGRQSHSSPDVKRRSKLVDDLIEITLHAMKVASDEVAAHPPSTAHTTLKLNEFITVAEFHQRLRRGNAAYITDKHLRETKKTTKQLEKQAKMAELADDAARYNSVLAECHLNQQARTLASYCFNCCEPTEEGDRMCDGCQVHMACKRAECVKLLQMHETDCQQHPPSEGNLRSLTPY